MSTRKFIMPVTNYLSPLEFNVIIKRIPNVEFYTQRANIPNISQSPVVHPTPFNNVFQTGDKMQFGNLDLSFVVDEEMNNYLEIYRWMKGITFPNDFNQYKSLEETDEGIFSDIIIQVLNSHKNKNLEITFINCFPISISDVLLDTTGTDVIYPEATVTFQYDSFSIKKLT
jgi:hypothetical protein